jgi:hypothetical protein
VQAVVLIDDDQAEGVEQGCAQPAIELVGVIFWDQAQLAGEREVEVADFTISTSSRRVVDIAAGYGVLE